MPAPISIKPKFWDHRDIAAGPYKHLFNFRRIWKLTVLLTAGVTIIPLVFMAFIDYKVTQKAMEAEIQFRTSRLVSNTRRAISFFLAERGAALEFVVQDNSFEALHDPVRLAELLKHLKEAFGGFTDLGVVDALGGQRTYVGPYELEGVDYSHEAWYQQVVERGMHVSDVFLGFRQVPHLIIAVKHSLPNGSFFVLRASIDTQEFNSLLFDMEVGGQGDIFLINHQGILQTPSRFYGDVLQKIPSPTPEFSDKTTVVQFKAPSGNPLVAGYAYITDTPFILMICKHKRELIESWTRANMQLLGFLVISILIILLVILGVSTYLVEQLFTADQRRVATLHQVEYANKMASIGRLAAGVAHEINNPLAIINEKAGLIKDLFAFDQRYAQDQKLLGLLDGILRSVARCATITRRLLNFARHMDDSQIVPLHLQETIQEVLGFLGKETEYRSIKVSLQVPDELPELQMDRSRLQQILLNLINNSFAAMPDGGHLSIGATLADEKRVRVTVADDGCGIPEGDLKRVFEPFFSTKTKQGGTGLGLSITYGLVQELGGHIDVESQLGKGTVFTITLPLTQKRKGGEANAGAACGR